MAVTRYHIASKQWIMNNSKSKYHGIYMNDNQAIISAGKSHASNEVQRDQGWTAGTLAKPARQQAESVEVQNQPVQIRNDQLPHFHVSLQSLTTPQPPRPQPGLRGRKKCRLVPSQSTKHSRGNDLSLHAGRRVATLQGVKVKLRLAVVSPQEVHQGLLLHTIQRPVAYIDYV
ncbi:predicted protein [Postia placenta Mad-698-R]|nr:predicted protein [Postia placenta Mad-698-R]